MTQEDKELLLKDLCARLPYGVKCQFMGDIIELQQITNLGKYGWTINGFDIKNCKPYLRSMSSISELISAKEWSSLGSIELIDFYNANHIDYRGFIEKGLALPAPEGMYKIKKD